MYSLNNYDAPIQIEPNVHTKVIMLNQTEQVLNAQPILRSKLGTFLIYIINLKK